MRRAVEKEEKLGGAVNALEEQRRDSDSSRSCSQGHIGS